MKRCGGGPKRSKTSMTKRWLGSHRDQVPAGLPTTFNRCASRSSMSLSRGGWRHLPAVRAHDRAPANRCRKRVEDFLPELFVFVAVPGVPAHNNLAERSVRPLVIARKISGGSRSPKGSQTRMGLASLFGTWMAQSLNPFQQCLLALTSKFSLAQV